MELSDQIVNSAISQFFAIMGSLLVASLFAIINMVFTVKRLKKDMNEAFKKIRILSKKG